MISSTSVEYVSVVEMDIQAQINRAVLMKCTIGLMLQTGRKCKMQALYIKHFSQNSGLINHYFF